MFERIGYELHMVQMGNAELLVPAVDYDHAAHEALKFYLNNNHIYDFGPAPIPQLRELTDEELAHYKRIGDKPFLDGVVLRTIKENNPPLKDIETHDVRAQRAVNTINIFISAMIDKGCKPFGAEVEFLELEAAIDTPVELV